MYNDSSTDVRIQQKRRRFGGNKKVMFTEGWVEFRDKRIAKRVAETLNTTRIGTFINLCTFLQDTQHTKS